MELLVIVPLPAVLVSQNKVSPAMLLTMSALPAVLEFLKLRSLGATKLAPTSKTGTDEESLTMPEPLMVNDADAEPI